MSGAAAALDRLRGAGRTLAVAESLTGGLLADALVSVPGASAVFRGGAITYATDTKASVLGVDGTHLERTGPVDPDVALQMADGARLLFGADLALATTGVAGPTPQGGQAVGTVYVALTGPGLRVVERLALPGDRPAVRAGAVAAALDLLERA